jgi:NTE family protein
VAENDLPFAERYLTASYEPALRHGDVRRLAMEGGGGKGNAYLGALFALRQLGVLQRLQTVAGSSAGAITALTLSLGMKPHETFEFMSTTDFTKFFDHPDDRTPVAGAPYRGASGDAQTARQLVYGGWVLEASGLHVLGQIAAGIRRIKRRLSATSLEVQLARLFKSQDVRLALLALQRARQRPTPTPEPLKTMVIYQLVDALPDYLTSLTVDMGIFSGEVARDTFADLIAARLAARGADPGRGQSRAGGAGSGRRVTFAQLDSFCDAFGYPRLRVSGSELCTLKSVIFSGDSTPNFPVADAVRISMGLPFVYKPYTLRSTGAGLPPCGVYVDGGVFSNLPLLAYTDEEAAGTVGLRLEIEKPTRIEGLLGFLGQLAQASLFAGESSVVEYRSRRSARLDTEPLDLFDFTAERAILEKVAIRAQLTTMLFFGRGTDFAPVDLTTGEPLPKAQARTASDAAWEDLQASIKLRRERAGCVYEDSSAPG